MDWDQVVDGAVQRASALATLGHRRILGIVGPPGGGKSTLARAMVERLGDLACCVPMDGFHLSNAELTRLDRRGRKGAPDTFDAAGYVALLRRLRSGSENAIYSPAFNRGLDEPIAAAICIAPETPLVVTEGNYLLLDQHPWSHVRELLDQAWYIDGDDEGRLAQLVQRHIAFGKTPDAARAWAHGSDQRNADLVVATKDRADHVVHLPRQDVRRPCEERTAVV